MSVQRLSRMLSLSVMHAPKNYTQTKNVMKMLVFTTYLGNIITVLKYSNVEAMHQIHKELMEELYHKHQEINQYKESIRFFFTLNKGSKNRHYLLQTTSI